MRISDWSSDVCSSDLVRARARLIFETLTDRHILIIVADPQLRAISTLIETSAWEAALCPVQCTDFRNFAHGRHAWIHHRRDRTILPALTGRETRQVWEPLAAGLPPPHPRRPQTPRV